MLNCFDLDLLSLTLVELFRFGESQTKQTSDLVQPKEEFTDIGLVILFGGWRAVSLGDQPDHEAYEFYES